MSETTDNSGDSHDAVRAATMDAAGGAAAVSAATDAAMDKPAPDSMVEQFIRAAEDRFSRIEQTLFGLAPQIQAVYDSLEKPVEAALPASVPVFTAIDAIAATLNAVIGALHLHFGEGKLALPDPIGAVTVPAPNAG